MTFTSDNRYQETVLLCDTAKPDLFSSEDLRWIIQLQNEERQSVAHQLRDSVGQVLTCCKLLLETKQPNNEKRVLELVNKHLQQSISEIMHLSYKLSEGFK